MSEKCFVNEMVKLLMVLYQWPSRRIKEVFSLMVESVATALQNWLKVQRFELG